MNVSLFPARTFTKPIAVTGAASVSTALPGQGSTLRVVNASNVDVYISVGSAAQTATIPNATPTATSVVVMARTDGVYAIPGDAVQNISAITDGGTGTIFVSVGEGA